ncbi:MAG: UDP-2,3-diacylglucosamine diphosphatase [Verrucomicrobiota bacterium]
MIEEIKQTTKKYRAIWISDVHLGARSSRPECLLDFLRYHESDYLYLNGDIIDGWRLKKAWYWNQAHNDVIQKILRRARKGARVFYIPGNHDQFARDYIGMHFGGIVICEYAIHETVEGKRLLVMHGDDFDGIVTYAKWLAMLGSGAYEASVAFNRWLNHVRAMFGMSYWSISAMLKRKVKNAMTFIENYENAVINEVRRKGVDGAVCGHIHRAVMKHVDGLSYYNTGDWVESFTALVEHYDGRMEIIKWPFQPERPAARGIGPNRRKFENAEDIVRDVLEEVVPST